MFKSGTRSDGTSSSMSHRGTLQLPSRKPVSRKMQPSSYQKSGPMEESNMGCCNCCGNTGGLSYDELEDCLRVLQQKCLTHRMDSYRIHSDRKKGCRLLLQMIQHSRLEEYSITHIIGIIWCALSIVHHFHVRNQLDNGWLVNWSRRRDALAAVKAYNKLMKLTLPTFLTTVLQSVVTFFNEGKLWDLELYCTACLQKVLEHSNDISAVVNALLDVIELSSVDTSKRVLRVLYQVLETLDWPQIEESLIIRFMLLYRRSLLSGFGPAEERSDFYQLNKGLQVCLRYLFRNIRKSEQLTGMRMMLEWSFYPDTTDDMVLEYSNLLEYASTLHDKEVYRFAITDTIFPLVLNMIASDRLLLHLLGNRLLQQMLDRHSNVGKFQTPQLFLQNLKYDFELEEYISDDKNFLKDYRGLFHAKVLKSVQLHGRYWISLDSIYRTLAIILVEVPCGFTAAFVVCLTMAIQELALTQTNLDQESTHRIHAMVMSIMSLVCWIHDAGVFYDYLNVIMGRRADMAPFLNPPFHTTYRYALHHVIWNKPELFFEAWEARYGLWKCFKNKINR